MTRGWIAGMTRWALIPVLALAALSATAGCSASFCAGSGCDKGTIVFGTSFKQDSGSISIVGKKDTFKLGEPVTMLATLSEDAGAKQLTLEVTGKGSHRSVPYGISSASSNELANQFKRADLDTLGITASGDYTFRILRGSKELAKGSMTEK